MSSLYIFEYSQGEKFILFDSEEFVPKDEDVEVFQLFWWS